MFNIDKMFNFEIITNKVLKEKRPFILAGYKRPDSWWYQMEFNRIIHEQIKKDLEIEIEKEKKWKALPPEEQLKLLKKEAAEKAKKEKIALETLEFRKQWEAQEDSKFYNA